MKFSKLLLFAAASLCLGTACSDDEEPVVKPVEDAIALTPAKATVSSKGGTVSTMVTSSGEWTLSDEQNAFVQPSATTGNDGDLSLIHI